MLISHPYFIKRIIPNKPPALGIDKQQQITENNTVFKNVIFMRKFFLLFKSQKGFVVSAILFDLLETLVIAGAIFVVIYAFLARPYQVSGSSMFPTYKDKEYILTNLIVLRLDKLKRGDVIVFVAPNNNDKDYIKRVIGLPEESVKIKNGNVYVNGILLDESAYLPHDFKTFGNAFIGEGVEQVVPKDSYFVLGDNRNFSSDSREWGFVKKEKIIGKASLVYWPVTQIHLVQLPKYNISNTPVTSSNIQ